MISPALAAVGGNRHPIINAIEILGLENTTESSSAKQSDFTASNEKEQEVSVLTLNDIPILYPNPAKNYTIIRINSEVRVIQVNLFDLTGKLVKSYEGAQLNRTQEGIELNLVGIENGLYMISVLPEYEPSYRLKLIINNYKDELC